MTYPPPPGPPLYDPWAGYPLPQQWARTIPTGPRVTPDLVIALRWVLGSQLVLAATGAAVSLAASQHRPPGDDAMFNQFGQQVSGAACVVTAVLLLIALAVAFSARGGPRMLLWLPQAWNGLALFIGGQFMVMASGALEGVLVTLMFLTAVPALVLALQRDVREWARPEHPQFPSYLHP